jgi:hypothetical protein
MLVDCEDKVQVNTSLILFLLGFLLSYGFFFDPARSIYTAHEVHIVKPSSSHYSASKSFLSSLPYFPDSSFFFRFHIAISNISRSPFFFDSVVLVI